MMLFTSSRRRRRRLQREQGLLKPVTHEAPGWFKGLLLIGAAAAAITLAPGLVATLGVADVVARAGETIELPRDEIASLWGRVGNELKKTK